MRIVHLRHVFVKFRLIQYSTALCVLVSVECMSAVSQNSVSEMSAGNLAGFVAVRTEYFHERHLLTSNRLRLIS